MTRAWSAWLAGDRPERGWRYRAFEEALGEEERAAAEVERAFELAEAGQQAELDDRLRPKPRRRRRALADQVVEELAKA